MQTWDPKSYADNVRFVSDLGLAVVELLAPRPGERILDLGCGDGDLTVRLRDMGCQVVGADSSLPQLRVHQTITDRFGGARSEGTVERQVIHLFPDEP